MCKSRVIFLSASNWRWTEARPKPSCARSSYGDERDVAPAPASVSLRWFYENRFLPQKQQQWKVASGPKAKRFIENYLLKRFGDTLLCDVDKFTLQTYLN